MPPRGLTTAAAQYGIGPDYEIEGITTVSGSVPPTVNMTERTEDGFGQGRYEKKTMSISFTTL
jgi:hypothetical protein